MAWFNKKKDVGAESKVFAGNTARFHKVRADVEDAIKKNNLTDELIDEYLNICESMRLQLSNPNSKKELMKENPNLSEQNFQRLIENMTNQINWALHEMKTRGKVRDMTIIKEKGQVEYIRPEIEKEKDES